MVRISAGMLVHGLTRIYVRAFWRNKGVSIDPTTRLVAPHLMDLGRGIHVGLFSLLAAIPTPDCEVAPLLKVGERTWIGDHVNIYAQEGLVTIGKACLIANAVTIISCTHGIKPDTYMMDQPRIRRDVHIGDDVWIGSGVMVLPGSRIGQGAIVGAGAVVRGTVEPYDIVVGIPTRVIGSRKNRV